MFKVDLQQRWLPALQCHWTAPFTCPPSSEAACSLGMQGAGAVDEVWVCKLGGRGRPTVDRHYCSHHVL
jgi:hypothetical protein